MVLNFATAPFGILCSARNIPPTCSATQSYRRKSDSQGKINARPYGYWTKLENIVDELREFAESQNDPNRMPTQAELLAAGRADIVGAVRRKGSWLDAAESADLVPTSIVRPRSVYLSFCTPILSARPHNYWKDFTNLRNELEPYIVENKLPNAQQLHQLDRSDLIRAIGMHGGFPMVSERLKLRARYRSSKYWLNFDNLANELLDFIHAHGVRGVMPPLALLREGAPQGLLSAIQYRHGGSTAVARRMGLKCEYPRRPHGYWQLHKNRLDETREFVEHLRFINPTRDPDRMPTYSEFIYHQRQDLVAALMRHEGLHNMAKCLGLRVRRKRRSK